MQTLVCTRKINLARQTEKILNLMVVVVLDTREYEVIVTTLLDESEYPTEDFKYIYRLRWDEETFYGIFKTWLNLENFSGKTADCPPPAK